jgi:hypothetical protein
MITDPLKADKTAGSLVLPGSLFLVFAQPPLTCDPLIEPHVVQKSSHVFPLFLLFFSYTCL